MTGLPAVDWLVDGLPGWRQRRALMDPLSDILRGVRLSGALFLNARFGGDWCVAAPDGADLATRLAQIPGPARLFHLVTEGECQLQIGEQPALHLRAGDIVFFPHGDAHRIGTALRGPPLDVARVMDDLQRRSPLALSRLGDGTPSVHLVCGWLASEAGLQHPLFQALPAVLHVSLRQWPSAAWLEPALQHLVGGTDGKETAIAGREAVAARLAEALFIETLSCHLAGIGAHQGGWLAALSDPLVGRALAALHAQPGLPWTLELLARRVGSSRSVLSERFASRLGMPPMRYLARWRLQRGSELLAAGSLSLIRIAEAVGYGTEAAFSRAFRRAFGAPPSVWRRHRTPAAGDRPRGT